jgi:hypothetical protein
VISTTERDDDGELTRYIVAMSCFDIRRRNVCCSCGAGAIDACVERASLACLNLDYSMTTMTDRLRRRETNDAKILHVACGSSSSSSSDGGGGGGGGDDDEKVDCTLWSQRAAGTMHFDRTQQVFCTGRAHAAAKCNRQRLNDVGMKQSLATFYEL